MSPPVEAVDSGGVTWKLTDVCLEPMEGLGCYVVTPLDYWGERNGPYDEVRHGGKGARRGSWWRFERRNCPYLVYIRSTNFVFGANRNPGS